MRSYRIQISDAEDNGFSCEEDDTILSAALRSGKALPYECNSGGCGSCQIELLEGEVNELWPDAPGLSSRARDRGRRLACQCVPVTDCSIRVKLANQDIPVAPLRRSLTFMEARALTADMSEFCFQSTGPADFLPGQYAMLGLPGIGGLRAYSMSNLPNRDGEWRFVIKRVPGGKATANLFGALQPGDPVSLDAPYGNSYLRTGNGRDIVCVAGGSGLSPVLSILRGAVRSAELENQRIHLFYGGRGPQDICITDIFENDPLLQERVEVHAAISDDNAPGAEQWQGERGFVHELVKKDLGDEIPGFDFYFCGPPPMTDAVHRMLLLDYKVPATQLHFDRFF